MKFEKIGRFGNQANTRAIVTKTPNGWLITRLTALADTSGKTSKTSNSSIVFTQVVDSDHSINPEDFFFEFEE